MPNWCENRVYLEAPESEIQSILEACRGEEKNLLSYLRPEPEHPESEAGEMPSWYDWRVDNWGTKWEVNADAYSHGEGWVNIAFDSAWAPPIEALRHWQEQDSENRSFNIRFIEWGMAFTGEADSDGQDMTFDIPLTVEAVKEIIPAELDEEFGISDMVAQWEDEEQA